MEYEKTFVNGLERICLNDSLATLGSPVLAQYIRSRDEAIDILLALELARLNMSCYGRDRKRLARLVRQKADAAKRCSQGTSAQ